VPDDLYEALQAASDTYTAKNADYGDSWKKLGLLGVLVRMSDKWYRIEHLFFNKDADQKVTNESLEDTIRDMLVYAAMAATLAKEISNGN